MDVARIITTLSGVQEVQRISGNVAEIGVHHGNLFIRYIYSREATNSQSRLIYLQIRHETSIIRSFRRRRRYSI
jgi:hypothetical protein